VVEFELERKEQPIEASRQAAVGGALRTVQETKWLWHRDEISCWCFQGQQMEKGQSKQMNQGVSLCRLLPARPLFTFVPPRHAQAHEEADIHIQVAFYDVLHVPKLNFLIAYPDDITRRSREIRSESEGPFMQEVASLFGSSH
jgi:hypothetical protein